MARRRTAHEYLSTFLFIVLHLSIALVLVYPPTWRLAAVALASYLFKMWSVTVGHHRYFAHRSFRTSRVFGTILALCAASAMQNGPIWWASWHRRHHRFADQPADPHSPKERGLWHAHIGWFFDGSHEVPDLTNVRDLTRLRELRFVERYNWLPLAAFMLGCLLVGGAPGLLWGFVIPTLATLHVTAMINSVAHRIGTRRFETPDDSRNNALLAVLTLGEGWHNNHHQCMTSARQGLRWWEIDVSYYSIVVLGWLRVVWDIRPARHELLRRAPLVPTALRAAASTP